MEPTYTTNLRRTTIDLKKPEKAAIQRTQNFDQQGKAYNRVSTLQRVDKQSEKVNAKLFGYSNSSGPLTINSKYIALTNSSGSF